MPKHSIYEQELAKLTEIFKDVESNKRQLAEGLIQDAAFLLAENHALRANMASTGMVKVHPEYPEIQKPTESAKQYLKNVNSYAVVIKTLNGILNKSGVEEEEELSEFE